MGRINYTIPDEHTEERLEILEGIVEDINLMIADTKLDYDDDDDWFYPDEDEENF